MPRTCAWWCLFVPGCFLEGCNESDRDSGGHKGLRNGAEDVCSHEC